MTSQQAATMVIAIDGPSGSGKSTVARAVATRLGLRYLDTGALYRALTVRALQRGTDLGDPAAIAAAVADATLVAGTDPGTPGLRLDGVDVGRAIRTREVTNAVSSVSAVPAVRAQLLALQRDVIASGGVVVEGRDIGTVVAPDADVKIFLTASSAARAARRHREDAAAGEEGEVGRTLEEIERRDARDTGRRVSPLAQAADAVVLDSTTLSAAEVVEAVLAVCAAAGLPSEHTAAPSTGSTLSHDQPAAR